ncbi:transposase [Leisingera thetidis]|uniref:transposase n=1 Tax=Leisingera thetidis TaxID=2930199 RepID=UPI003D9C8294
MMQEVTAKQNRSLEPCYPVVLMDAIRVNIRSDGAVSKYYPSAVPFREFCQLGGPKDRQQVRYR